MIIFLAQGWDRCRQLKKTASEIWKKSLKSLLSSNTLFNEREIPSDWGLILIYFLVFLE